MPIWISDTSPICYFARLGLLDVLHKLLGQIRVPMSVVDEIDRGRAFIPELPVNQLKKMGFRFSDSLQNTVLSLAGED